MVWVLREKGDGGCHDNIVTANPYSFQTGTPKSTPLSHGDKFAYPFLSGTIKRLMHATQVCQSRLHRPGGRCRCCMNSVAGGGGGGGGF